METLTKENARDGMTVRHCTNMPDVTETLQRNPGDTYWCYYPTGSDEFVNIPDREMCDWLIVEEATEKIAKRCENCDWSDKRGIGMGVYCSDCKARGPDGWWKPKSGIEPPLVALDPQNPPELPLGHPDEASRTLQAQGKLVDEAIAEFGRMYDEVKYKGPIPCIIATKAISRFKEMQALIGNKASSMKTDPADETIGDKIGRLGDEISIRLAQVQEMAMGVFHG